MLAKEKTPERIIFTLGALGAAVMLILASGRHPYDYYTILRWLVTLVCVLGLYISITDELKYSPWLTGIIGLAFNPIVPFHLKKGTWNVLDPIFAILMAISVVLIWVEVRQK